MADKPAEPGRPRRIRHQGLRHRSGSQGQGRRGRGRGHRHPSRQRRRGLGIRRTRRRQPQSHARQRRRHPPIGAGRGRRPELARPPPVARRQLEPDGLQGRCKDPSCTGEAKARASVRAAATALALLPFLAAGQTHESKGRYKQNIYAGIAYLIKNQKPDGDLRMGGDDVRSWPGGDRPVRMLRNERRQAGGAGGPGGLELHHGSARPRRRRLALCTPRARRHVGGRLADHGAEERPDGLPDRQSGGVGEGQGVPRIGVAGHEGEHGLRRHVRLHDRAGRRPRHDGRRACCAASTWACRGPTRR